MESIKNLTNDLECHFNWNIRSIVGEKEIVDKLKEKNEEIAGQPWRNLLISLTTAYELYLNKDSGASEKLQEAITMWGNSDDEFTMKYKDAFRHVIYSMKLFFVKDNSSHNVIKEIYNYIPPYLSLPTQQRVAITAIKAHVFSEYGPKGTKHALELAKEALKKDPAEGEWSFLVGKMLSRIRQFSFDFCVTEEELECLRRAYALSKSPAHAVFLAQTYCTISKALFNKLPVVRGRRMLNGDEGRIIRSYNDKAATLFNEALKENDDKCVHINFRCARGLYNLPGEFKNLLKAQSIVEKTLERAPTNVYGNNVAGNIYYSIGEYEKAFKHIKAAEEGGSFGASIKKFQMAYEQHLNINPEKEYEEIFKKQTEIMYKIQTCMHAISFFIFKKRNLYKALDYFSMAAEWDATLDDFYCFIYWIKETTDLCFIVYNEVKCAMEDIKPKAGERFHKLKHAIIIVNTKYPKVTERPLRPNFVDFLIKRAPKFYKKKAQQNPKYKNRKVLIEQSERKENHSKNGNNFGNKDNFSAKNRKQGKPSYGRRLEKRRGERERKNSVSSNASVSSVSSVTSTGSFKNIRKSSREACLLNIVNKDLERETHCKNIKEVEDSTQDTYLRPRQHDGKSGLPRPDSKEQRPLSLGCSGWSNKSNENLSTPRKSYDRPNYQKNKSHQQNKDVSQMSKMFRNMNFGSNNNQGLRPNASPSSGDGRRSNFMPFGNSANTQRFKSQSFSDNEFKSDGRKQSISADDKVLNTNNSMSESRNFRSSLENVQYKDNSPKYTSDTGTPKNQPRGAYMGQSSNSCSDRYTNQGKSHSFSDNENKSFGKMQRASSIGAYGEGLNIDNFKIKSKSFRSSLDNVQYKDNSNISKFNTGRDSPRNQSRGAGMGQSFCNSGRYTNQNKSQSSNKGLVRKPFNLNRTDSLDSDDSASCHGSERSRKFSTSSVDSDYVKDPNVPYFPWHNKYSAKK